MSSSIFSINYTVNPRPITYSSNPFIFPIKTQDSIGHLSSFAPSFRYQRFGAGTWKPGQGGAQSMPWGNLEKNTGIQFWLFDRYKDV